ISFSLHWDMMQQGGTNPFEWEYGAGASVVLATSFGWRGGSEVFINCEIRSLDVDSVWARWRQTGMTMALPKGLIDVLGSTIRDKLNISALGAFPLTLPGATKVDPRVLADRLV